MGQAQVVVGEDTRQPPVEPGPEIFGRTAAQKVVRESGMVIRDVVVQELQAPAGAMDKREQQRRKAGALHCSVMGPVVALLPRNPSRSHGGN
jgi:hypothetical protein